MIMLSKYEFRGVSLHRYGGRSLSIPTLQDRIQLLGNHIIYPIPLEIKMNYIIIKTNRAGIHNTSRGSSRFTPQICSSTRFHNSASRIRNLANSP